MKGLVFYKELLSRKDLSLTSRCLWSWLISEVVKAYDGGISDLCKYLDKRDGVVRVAGVDSGVRPLVLGISKATYLRKMSELRDAGVFVDGMLSCLSSVVSGGFFELRADGRFLSVEEMVLYGWYYDRCLFSNASYIWVANAFAADVFGVSAESIRRYKVHMNSVGLLDYRKEDGVFYTGVPALHSKLGGRIRKYTNKVKTIKVDFE